jgi:hypothetical protein
LAYKRQDQRLLDGGVNLHAPGDLLPENGAQDIKNFAYDQKGNLRSRRGHTLVSSIGSAIHSQIKAIGSRFQGASTALYKAGVSITSGFDGNPLGLTSQQKWLWVMNQSKQCKYDGTNVRDWGIAPPAAAPTTAAGAELATTIATFEAAEAWTVDPTGVESYDADHVEGTTSLYLNIQEEGTWTASATKSLDLSVVGGSDQSDLDKFRLYIYTNRGRRIDDLTVLIDCGDGSFKNDFYRAVIPHKFFRHAKKEWTPFYIRRTQPAKDDGLPYFERVGSTAGKDWATVAAIRLIVDTRAKVKVKFDKFQVYGSTDAQIEGTDIQYYVTWANDDGHESNPSDPSDKIVVDLHNVVVTRPAAGADAQVTKWNLWREGGGLDGVYRVNRTPIAIATTSYNDTQSNDDLTLFGKQMPTDNDLPPAAKVLAGPYLGYQLAANTSAHKARLHWSKQWMPYAFPGAALDEGNWVDIGDTGEEILAMTVRPRVVLVYKENTIHRIVGDIDLNPETEITNSPIGIIGQNGVCKAGSSDVLHAKDGIYIFNGDDVVKISDNLDPIFRGLTTTLASGVTIPPISTSNRHKSCVAFKNDRIYFSYPESGQSEPNITVVFNKATSIWTRDSRGFRSIYNEGENGELLGGLSAGDLVAMENGTDDAGSSIPLVFHSRLFNAGLPDSDKTWEDCTIEANTGGTALTVTAYTSDGAVAIALGTITSSSRQRFVLSLAAALGVVSRNIAIRVSGSVSAQAEINALVVNFYPEARQAKSFDTDELSLGTHKLKLVREAKIDADNAAAITVTLRSDHPGEAMTLRDTKAVALSSTRRMAHVVFNGDIKGFLHRVVMAGNDFRIYALWLLVKVIGTYLLGGKGEFYSSDALDFQTERIKMIREFEVVYSSTGTAAMTIYTDLPGTGALALRVTKTLAATTGEQSAKVRVPADLWGRLIQIYITPTTDFQLEAIRARMKSIGEPNASGWAWVALPVVATEDAVWMEVPIPVDEAA